MRPHLACLVRAASLLMVGAACPCRLHTQAPHPPGTQPTICCGACAAHGAACCWSEHVQALRWSGGRWLSRRCTAAARRGAGGLSCTCSASPARAAKRWVRPSSRGLCALLVLRRGRRSACRWSPGVHFACVHGTSGLVLRGPCHDVMKGGCLVSASWHARVQPHAWLASAAPRPFPCCRTPLSTQHRASCCSPSA